MDHVPTEPHDTQHAPYHSIPMDHIPTEPMTPSMYHSIPMNHAPPELHDTQHVPAHSAIPG